MFSKLAPPEAKGKGKEFDKIVRTKFSMDTKTIGVFVGNPVEVYKHWEGEYPNRQYRGTCEGENCTLCQEGISKTYSIQANFLTVVDGTPTMTIVEGPASLARAMQQKEEVKGTDFFDGAVVLINRTDKTTFLIDDIKAPADLENLKAILAELSVFDIEAMITATIAKQTAAGSTTTNAPY